MNFHNINTHLPVSNNLFPVNIIYFITTTPTYKTKINLPLNIYYPPSPSNQYTLITLLYTIPSQSPINRPLVTSAYLQKITQNVTTSYTTSWCNTPPPTYPTSFPQKILPSTKQQYPTIIQPNIRQHQLHHPLYNNTNTKTKRTNLRNHTPSSDLK